LVIFVSHFVIWGSDEICGFQKMENEKWKMTNEK